MLILAKIIQNTALELTFNSTLSRSMLFPNTWYIERNLHPLKESKLNPLMPGGNKKATHT